MIVSILILKIFYIILIYIMTPSYSYESQENNPILKITIHEDYFDLDKVAFHFQISAIFDQKTFH